MSKQEKSRSQIALEKERKTFQKDIDKVRNLLVSKGAEDLIPMLLSDLENHYPIKELATSPNGRRK